MANQIHAFTKSPRAFDTTVDIFILDEDAGIWHWHSTVNGGPLLTRGHWSTASGKGLTIPKHLEVPLNDALAVMGPQAIKATNELRARYGC